MSLSSAQSYQWTGRVLQSLRRSLLEHDFLEILPALLSSEAEPGARHSVAVLGDRARPKVTAEGDGRVSVDGKWAYQLPVSHSVEKQMALEHTDRVYCLTPCLRLLMDGEEASGKHLYTFFQVVVEWRAADADEALTVTESILGSLARHLEPILPDGAGTAVTRLQGLRSGPYPRVSFADALKLGGRKPDEPQNSDLTRDEERTLTDSFDSPFWIHRYPLGVRDSLYQRGEDGLQETYDLMLPAGYGELATGGLRPRDRRRSPNSPGCWVASPIRCTPTGRSVQGSRRPVSVSASNGSCGTAPVPTASWISSRLTIPDPIDASGRTSRPPSTDRHRAGEQPGRAGRSSLARVECDGGRVPSRDSGRMGPQAQGGEQRQDAFTEPVGLLQMRLTREDELVDAEPVELHDPGGHLLMAAHQGGTRAASDQADTGPQIGRDLQGVATSAVQRDHAVLAFRFAAGQTLLDRADHLRGETVEQPPGLGPRLLGGVPGDHVEPDAETHGVAPRRGEGSDAGQLLGHLGGGSPKVR